MFAKSKGLVIASRLSSLISICAIAALGMSGCGGGGGGGGGGGSGGLPALNYTGNTNAAVITTGNAATLTANVAGSGDAPAIIVAGVATASSNAAQPPRGGLTDVARRLNRGFRGSVLQPGQTSSAQKPASGAIPVDDTTSCDSGSVRTSGTLSDAGTGILAVSFSDCRVGGDTLTGPATLRVDAMVDFGMELIPTDATFSFSRLMLRGSGVNVDLSGSLRSQLSIATNTETITANIVTLDNITGEMTKAENLVFVDVYNNVFFPSSYTESINGRVLDSVHGFVDVATIEPLVFSSLSQLFPNPGRLVLTGSGNRSIRVTAVSATQAMLELDLDGNTTYELWTTILWTQVSGTTVVDFVRPTAPVVSVTVNMDRSVTISWSPSSDSNGIREYRVRRGTMPIGRTTGTSFIDRSVEPGTVADYYVRAVDNAGNLSDLLPRQSVTIPSGGTAAFGLPISGTLPFASDSNGIGMGVADVNGDGSRDLVVLGGGIATALGPLTGGMSFTVSPVDFVSMTSQNNLTRDANLPFFHLADITGSSLPEALGGGRTLVWNTTNSVWVDSAGNQSSQFVTRAYIDLNDDGILDIIDVGSSNFTQTLFGTLGIGNGSYDASSTRGLGGIENFAWGGIGAIVATDIDRDGLTDLIVWDGDTIRVVPQTQRGSFAVTSSLPAITNSGFRAALLVADVTGDGYPEIIYAHYAITPDQLRVYVNNGAGVFGMSAISSNVLAPWNFSAADINGDGFPDLVVGNRLTTALDLYISQGDGTFTLLSSIPGVGFPNISLADIDLDDDMDIVISGSSFQSTDVKIYLNQ